MSLRLASLAQDLLDGHLFGQHTTNIVPSITSVSDELMKSATTLVRTGGGRSLSVNDVFTRGKRTSFAPKDNAENADADTNTANGAKKADTGDNGKGDADDVAGGADNKGVGGAGNKDLATKDDGTDQTDAKSVKVEEKGKKCNFSESLSFMIYLIYLYVRTKTASICIFLRSSSLFR